jgi:acyl carrier protein phosphodiesterase
MNFLAHIYLSGPNPRIMVGNFMGDFVKGRNLLDQYDREIVSGIELHRAIDDFTDRHPVVLESKIRLRSKYRHYAAVIVDIFYDHFLARSWNKFSAEPLESFTLRSYTHIRNEWPILPAGVRRMLPHMIRDNWLLHYAELSGIARVLNGMAGRSKFNSRMEESINDLEKDYASFQREFESFFPDIVAHAAAFLHDG